MMSSLDDIIWSQQAADVWAEGYPIGNGRLGAMVSGQPVCERISLNHDRLWRRYWKYKDKNLNRVFPDYQKLCLDGKYQDAIAFMKGKVSPQGKDIYVNPFVPAGDMGILLENIDENPENYKRQLNMEEAIVEVTFKYGNVNYKRESFVSFPARVIVTNIKTDCNNSINGEIFLYRMPDEECRVDGYTVGNEIVMSGEFDDGARFTVVSRIIAKRGTVVTGIAKYNQPEGIVAKKQKGFAFVFREFPHPPMPCGVSCKISAADEVTILTTIAVDKETSSDLTAYCKNKLDSAGTCYRRLKEAHVVDHRKLYKKVNLNLGTHGEESSTQYLVNKLNQGEQISPKIFEKMFKLGRYLAIAAGRGTADNGIPKAPINLQGIWNEDPRPAWDCDYHLDLNVEMSYWGLGIVNLTELYNPLADWAYELLPQARHAAKDIYGCGGAFYPCVCDIENIGNMCDLFMYASGTNAWLAQSIWQVWEYNQNKEQLKNKIYPVISEIGKFYEEFLKVDSKGRLVTAPSGSPENCPAEYPIGCILSVMSTFDIELLRELFENLIDAADILQIDINKQAKWKDILLKLPIPSLDNNGRLLEWLEHDYTTRDPGHRHRSHLVGICPGRRITPDGTPDYAKGVVKALELRHSHEGQGSCTLDLAWDAQIYARLHMAKESLNMLKKLLTNHAMGNLLLCLCDWRPGTGLRWFGGRRVFQIEASLGAMAAIAEMLILDRNGHITLLPALPPEWPDGNMAGLRTRDGFEVDIKWENGELNHACFLSLYGNICRVEIPGDFRNWKIEEDGKNWDFTEKGRIIEFKTRIGRKYTLHKKGNTNENANAV